MNKQEEQDELLWSAIESGTLENTKSVDTEIAKRFAAHQKLESLFAVLRQPTTLDDSLEQPSQISRYHVEKQLGEGAFGRVYLAHDPELDRLVAIKVPRADIFSSEHDAGCFLDEAKLAASLNHPGIVTIHDAGREGKFCFIVMEYVEGESLEQTISDNRLSTSRIAELVASIANALHHAHREGFVHRDLKPGNVLIDAKGQPHVADFGLAVSEQTQLRKAGQIAGTPAYMSPEQIRGETHRLDGRTDIWSLGVILYELLTARHPFLQTKSGDCSDEILHREPKPPRQINDGIPVELESVCLQCLSKDISKRYSTAADVGIALRKLSNQSEPSLQATLTPPSHWRFAWWLLLAVVCTSLAMGIGILLRGSAGDVEEAKRPTQDLPRNTLNPMVAREHPDVADLLLLVYDEVLHGSSPAAWMQVEKREKAESTQRWRPLENGSRLSSADRYRIILRAPEQTYFYVFQIDTRGQVDWAFPKNSASEHSTGSNPVSPNTTVKVPEGETTMFFLDESTGMEHVYIVATRQRWKALETKLTDLIGKRGMNGAGTPGIETPMGLKLRGIGGIASDAVGSSPVSGVRGVLAREIWFHHVESSAGQDK